MGYVLQKKPCGAGIFFFIKKMPLRRRVGRGFGPGRKKYKLPHNHEGGTQRGVHIH